MPCMDDDVLRRGKPTVHVQFGEAQALLAGDALQALAFELLTPDAGVAPALQARLCSLLARAAGHAGMAGGQAIDLASVGRPLDEHAAARHAPPQDRRAAAGQRADGRGLRRRRPAAAWTALRRLRHADRPGLPGGRRHPRRDRRRPRRSARPPARTPHHDKPTYVPLLGLDAARRHARRAARPGARRAATQRPADRSDWLALLADRIVDRDS